MSDFKSQLNEHCQKSRLPIPKYSTKPLSNILSHTPQFKSSVQLHDGQVFESQGSFGNKKGAEQSAAEEALKHIKQPSTSLAKTPTTSVTSSLTQDENTEKCSSEKEQTEATTSMSPDSSTVPSTVEKKENTVSSSNTNIPPLALSKNLLNERAQKLHLAPPSYNSFIEKGSYCSIVTFNNESYRSIGFHSQKKEAEKSAAQVALLALEGNSQTPQKPAVVPGPSVNQSEPGNTVTLGCEKSGTPQVISFKNVLQEYMQQRRSGENPKYSTVSLDNGFFKSTVEFSGKTAESSQGFPTKKEAEQSAARVALVSLGIDDPEEIALQSKGKGRSVKMHSVFKQLLESPLQRKRPRLDDDSIPSKRLKLESQEVIKEVGLINTLTVGEIWKEKGNVALVGNADTSFVLYCTRAANSLQLLNTRTMLNHTLEPGDRIISLDADIVNSQGKLVLQAERCADIEVPDKPDPVLISCGVVTLHQLDSSHIEVLLKRYLVSQAFVNVKAALAQFFRRALNGNTVSLPMNDLTEHMETWKLDEVVAIATMTAASIKYLFTTQWKFKEQWSQVLEPPLPRDLVELQNQAQQELSHRNAMGVNITDLENHPWSLPKGNFRHRKLRSGVHIEKPSECAVRELYEESGIQLFSADLETTPYIDVPQTDNLNPHKGDFSRYFLYVYKEKPNLYQSLDQSFTPTQKFETNTESIGMDLNTQVTSRLEKVNNVEKKLSSEDKDNAKMSPEYKTMQPVSLSQLLAEHSTPEKQSKSTDSSTKEAQEPTFIVLDDLRTSESSSSSSSPLPNQKTSPLNSEFPTIDEQNINEIENDDKNNDDGKDDDDEARVITAFKQSRTDFQKEDLGTQRGRKRKRSLSDDEEAMSDQPTTPSVDMASLSSYQSPSVKGGSHEECAWFLVEEAVKLSPVFARIYENQRFIDLLESLKQNNSDLEVKSHT